MEKLLNIKEVSDLLQVSQALVYKWVHYGFVPYIKLGTCVRFKKSKLEKWLNQRERKGRAKYRIDIN